MKNIVRASALLGSALFGLVGLASPALAESFTFMVANNSWDTMTKVEFALPGSGSWIVGAEGDQIDMGFASITVSEPSPDCRYDLRFTLVGGDGGESVSERLGIDICAQDKPAEFNVYTFVP